MKYQPRTQASNPSFPFRICLPALEKSNKSCETKSGTEKKLRDKIRNGKPGFETPCLDFLVVRLELDCSYLDPWLLAISRGLSERTEFQLVSTCYRNVTYYKINRSDIVCRIRRQKLLANWWKVRRTLSRIARFCRTKGSTSPNFAEKTFANSRNPLCGISCKPR